jgi:hypothetical protein
LITLSQPYWCPTITTGTPLLSMSAIVGDELRFQPLVTLLHDAVVETVAALAGDASSAVAAGATSARARRHRNR